MSFKERKKLSTSGNIRKRTAENSGSVLSDESNTLIKKKTKIQRGLISVTSKIKEQKEVFSFSSSESAKPEGEGDQYAAILVEKKSKQAAEVKEKIDEVTGKRSYQGLEAYTKPTLKGKAGPIKGITNLRVTCRFDYQPDICKDYKETGYCGYGDSCKFLHDRGDYKTGWELEKEWEDEQKLKRERISQPGGHIETHESDSEYLIEKDEEFPFACLICKKPFVKPVQTKCKHYFCQSCAVNRYMIDPRCAICKDNTNGIFNVAHKLAKLVEKRKEKEALEKGEEYALETEQDNNNKGVVEEVREEENEPQPELEEEQSDEEEE